MRQKLLKQLVLPILGLLRQAFFRIFPINLVISPEEMAKLESFKTRRAMRDLYRVKPHPLQGSGTKTFVWLIPEVKSGRGGRSTIFRIAQYLAYRGIQNEFLVFSRDADDDEQTKKSIIVQDYRFIPHARVRQIGPDDDLNELFSTLQGDILFATHFGSQLTGLMAQHFNRRILLLQDREGLFEPYGWQGLISDSSALDDFYEYLYAGPWLEAHSREIKHQTFPLGSDYLYPYLLRHLVPGRNLSDDEEAVHIAVYARPSTPRRATELIWITLTLLAQQHSPCHVIVHNYGEALPDRNLPFETRNHGSLRYDRMLELLRDCDFAISFSATNYSLLPFEALACGTQAIEVDTEANRLCLEGAGVAFISPLPSIAAHQLSEMIQAYLDNGRCHPALSERVLQERDWTECLEPVADFLGVPAYHPDQAARPSLSVCLPTHNAGPQFELFLESLKQQKLQTFEFCVIDSSSTDDTVARLRAAFPEVKLRQIAPQEFSHGGTRNQLVDMAMGERLLFLTQDALLADNLLLRTMVETTMEENIAQAFCRHTAYPHHSDFIKRDVEGTFNNLRRDMAWPMGEQDLGHNPRLLYFSSNNCCIYRRDLLQRIPFQAVNYGEDQLWTREVMAAGFLKAYVHSTVVIHSHDYEPEETFQRAETDAAYWKLVQNYKAPKSWTDLRGMNKRDIAFAKERGLADHVLAKRLAVNEARVAGRKAGLQTTKVPYQQGQKTEA